MLTSSMGLTLSTHFCGGHAMESSFNLGREHLDCGMMDMKKDCSEDARDMKQINQIPCCTNEFTTYNLQNEFNTTHTTSTAGQHFLIALVSTFLTLNIEEGEAYISHIPYSSPPLSQDIPVLNQSFLL